MATEPLAELRSLILGEPGGGKMIPKGALVGVIAVVAFILVLDVGGQFIPGINHTASPLVTGGALTFLGAVLTAARGPKPPAEPPPASEPSENDPDTPYRGGRHGREG